MLVTSTKALLNQLLKARNCTQAFRFYLVHLKLSPKLHLDVIQYLLKSECLDHEAVDKFKQFESILMVRKNMFSKTDSDQVIEESGVSVGVEVNETNDEKQYFH